MEYQCIYCYFSSQQVNLEVRCVIDLLSEEYQSTIYCSYKNHCIYTKINRGGGGGDTQKQNKKPNTTKNNLKKPNQKPKPKTPQKTEATCSAPGKYFQLGCIMIYNLSSVCYWQSWAVEKEELNQQLGPLRRLTLSLSFSFPYISYFIFSYFIYFHIILETKM